MLGKKNREKDRTAHQTQAGIGHSAPAHRGGHVQNSRTRRELRQGRYKTKPHAAHPRVDGRPSRKAEVCERGRGRRRAGAGRRRHAKQECRDKSHALQLHVPRGVMSHGSSRVEEERAKTSRGSHNRDGIGRKRCKRHRFEIIHNCCPTTSSTSSLYGNHMYAICVPEYM